MAKKEPKDWITVNGRHIPIYDGESKQDAYNRAVAKHNEDVKSKQISRNKAQVDRISNAHKTEKSQKEQFDAHKDALEGYVSGDTFDVNTSLRRGTLADYERDIVKELDEATSSKILYDKNLYRSVDAKSIFPTLSNSQIRDLSKSIMNGKLTDDQQKILDDAYKKVHTEKGFMSTSKDLGCVENLGDYTVSMGQNSSNVFPILIIKPNKHTTGVDVSAFDKQFSDDPPQKEILLSRNQKYAVNKIYAKGGKIFIDVELK